MPDQGTTVGQVGGPAVPYQSTLYGAAQGVAAQPYMQFGQRIENGQVVGTPQNRVADQNQYQQQALGMAGTLGGPDPYGTAKTSTQQGMDAMWSNPDWVSKYMNPYQQNVTNIATAEAARNSAIQGTQDASTFAKAGAFGGSRHGVVDAERGRNLGQLQNQIQVQGANQAYNTGMQQFNADRTNWMTGANQLANMGTLQANLDQNRMTSLNTLGTQNQQHGQNQIDANYNQFTEQRDYGKNQLGWMNNILSGSPTASSSTFTGTPTNDTTAGAGLVTQGIGAMFDYFGNSNSGNTGQTPGINSDYYLE